MLRIEISVLVLLEVKCVKTDAGGSSERPASLGLKS